MQITPKKNAVSKDPLLRALITKICTEKTLPNLPYEEFFYNGYFKLFQRLQERKNDLPSLDYIVKTYGFEAEETDFTFTDIFEELNNYYFKEKFTNIVETAIRDTKQDSGNIVAAIDKISKEFNQTRRTLSKVYTVDLSKDKDKVIEEYKKSGEQGAPIPTGFRGLDEAVSPRPGNLLLLVAGTGSGKTLSMTKMMAEAVKNGIPSLYFSLEMGMIEMTNRLLAALGRFEFRKLYFNEISPEEYAKAIDEIKTQVHIITRQTEAKIDLASIERNIEEHKPKIVFIDYLTLVDADTAWNAEVSITGQLKRMALQNGCLIVVAAQADSETLKSGEIPTLTGTAKNKGFVWDADIFLGIASQRYDGDEGKMRVNFAVRKSRNGGLPEFSYRVKPNAGAWEECTGDLF